MIKFIIPSCKFYIYTQFFGCKYIVMNLMNSCQIFEFIVIGFLVGFDILTNMQSMTYLEFQQNLMCNSMHLLPSMLFHILWNK
jgi:hypothetical protein